MITLNVTIRRIGTNSKGVAINVPTWTNDMDDAIAHLNGFAHLNMYEIITINHAIGERQ